MPGMEETFRRHYSLIASLFFLFSISTCISFAREEPISPENALQYIGKDKTVCGAVASTTYNSGQPGQPTFLHLNRSFPNQIFTIIIWGTDRHRFKKPPELHFDEKNVCVTGKILSHEGTPQIAIEKPSQIKIQTQPGS